MAAQRPSCLLLFLFINGLCPLPAAYSAALSDDGSSAFHRFVGVGRGRRAEYAKGELAEYVRARTARPASAPALENYKPRQGYLRPTAAFVASPSFFWFPFRSYRPAAPLGASGASPSVSSLESLGSFSDDFYYEREAGSAAVNRLPEWIQASLRLSHHEATFRFAADPLIKPGALSADAWQAAYEQVRQLQMRLQRLAENIKDEQRAANYRALLGDAQSALAHDQAGESAARARWLAVQKVLSELDTQVKQQKKLVEALRAERWLCNHLVGWAMRCDVEGDDLLDQLQGRHALADREREQTGREHSAALELVKETERHYDNVRREAGRRPHASPESVRTLRQLHEALGREIDTAAERVVNGAGFLKVDPRALSFASCAEPYVFSFVPGTLQDRHPFFPEPVLLELVPQADYRLAVCLTPKHHIASVYIVDQQGAAFARSELLRDEQDRIRRVSISGVDGQTLEATGWIPLAENRTRLTYTFRNDQGEETSLYTDVGEAL